MIEGDQLIQKDVRRKFDRCAENFNNYDFFHTHCRENLFERLDLIKLKPEFILNLGSAIGSGSEYFHRNYNDCNIINLDLSNCMLKKSVEINNKNTHHIQAFAEFQPLVNSSVDLIFANLLMPWINNLSFFLHEIKRVLKKDGLFIFTTLGPDSLNNLKMAWSTIDNNSHVNNFIDMHIIGDQILNAGLKDPVLDNERLTVNYKNVNSLIDDLTNTGARNSLSNRGSYLIGKKKFREFKDNLFTMKVDGLINVELEIIYGHAWGADSQIGPNEFHFDASKITKR